MDPHDEVLEQRVGQTIAGRWILRQLIGAGGMAAVYAADGPGGQIAAIKLLHPEMACRREIRERFLREAAVMAKIAHPSMVTILEHGQGAESAYLVMELLSGESVAERVRRDGRLSTNDVLVVLDQVLDVLVLAHSLGIIHRDLKPENLFLTRDGRTKVLDFGLARLLDAGPGSFLTRTGAALGTLPYMAPEQALGRRDEIDARTDIFAVGATAYRLLSGRRIHEAPSEAELLMFMASEPAKPLLSVAPDLRPGVAQVVDRALAFTKTRRYPDAATMQRDVRDLLSGRNPTYAVDCCEQDQSAATKIERVIESRTAPAGSSPNTTRPLYADNHKLPVVDATASRQLEPTAVEPHVTATQTDTGAQLNVPVGVPPSRRQLPATIEMASAMGAIHPTTDGGISQFVPGASIPIAPLSDAVLERRRRRSLAVGIVTLFCMSGLVAIAAWYLLVRPSQMPTGGANATATAIQVNAKSFELPPPAVSGELGPPIHPISPIEASDLEIRHTDRNRAHRRGPPNPVPNAPNAPNAIAAPRSTGTPISTAAVAWPQPSIQLFGASVVVNPVLSPSSAATIGSHSNASTPVTAPASVSPAPDPKRKKKPTVPRQPGHRGR